MIINNISIIGGGNLGTSIARGIRSLDKFKKENILISEKRTSRADYLREEGFAVNDDTNAIAVENADMVIVAVKPQQFADVLKEIRPSFSKDKILVSTVTGVELSEIENHLGDFAAVRIMPNTAIEIKESFTCLCFNNTNNEQEKAMLELFNKLGVAVALPEEQLDAVTVLGSCGIAFALRFIRAATQGGIEIGFSAELSQLIAAQTVKGAAMLLLENESHPEKEIDKVTTPQGITISGLNEMEHQGFSSSVIKGLLASFNKLTGKK